MDINNNSNNREDQRKEIDLKQVTSDIHKALHQITYDIGYMHGQQAALDWAWIAAGIGMLIVLAAQIAWKLYTR